MCQQISTFIGIAVHTVTATTTESQVSDLAAGVRQDATGLLGTTLQISDLVSCLSLPLGVLHEYTTLFASLFPGHSFCCRRISLYRRCSRLAYVSTLVILLDALLVFCHVSRQLASSILITRILFKRALSFQPRFAIFAKKLSIFPSRLLAESKSTKQALREASTYGILLLEMMLMILTVCSYGLRSRVHVHGSVGVSLILTVIDF